jgi:hypothetical protein
LQAEEDVSFIKNSKLHDGMSRTKTSE